MSSLSPGWYVFYVVTLKSASLAGLNSGVVGPFGTQAIAQDALTAMLTVSNGGRSVVDGKVINVFLG